MTEWTERFAGRMARVRASEIRELLKLLDQPDILSFAGGIPDPTLFPTARMQAAYAAVMQDEALARQALQYSVTEGLPGLRAWVAERMTAAGAPCGPENVLITAGSQQALDLIGRLFIAPGARVLVERPTYMGALGAFNAYEPTYGALDLDGPPPGPARLAYVVPDYANPGGRSLTLDQRERLLDYAEAGDMVIVEDGAYRELRFEGELLPMILALDIARSGSIERARTAFCGTLSKTLSPALRLGWVCAPTAVIEKLVLLKQGGDLHASTINQMIAERVLATGYEAHLETLRAHYRDHARAMQAALARHMPEGVRWSEPKGGMFVWLELPDGLDAKVLLEQALAGPRVAFVPGEPFFATDGRPNTLRLSYSLPTPAEIDEGVRRLAGVIEAALSASRSGTLASAG